MNSSLQRQLEKTRQELEISRDQLTKAKDNFKSLVNAIAEPVVIVDHKGRFLEINDKVVELTGFSEEELLGKNFLKTDIVPMKSKAILIKNLAKRMMGFHVKPYEIEVNRKNGDPLYTEVVAKKIEYENKSADLVVFHDITERKMLEEKREKYAEQLEEEVKERTKTLRENEEKLRSIFNSSADAIAALDLNGNIVECNQAASDMLGFSAEDEVIGKSALGFVAKKDRQKAMETLKNVLEKNSIIRMECDVLAKDGREFPSEFSASTIRDSAGIPTGIVVLAKDITERKKMEDALKLQRDIAITLSGARDLSEALNRLFDNLLKIEEVDCAGFYLVDKDTGELDMIIHRGLPDRFVEKVSHLDADSPYTKVVMEGKPIYQKTSDFPPAIREDLQSDGIFAVAAIPIQYKGEVIGDLNLASHTHDEISASAHRVLESVGAQIGETIVRARMEEELRQYSENLEAMVEERTRALKESQELLVKSERLAAIGQAATMVGHDLRNPLQAIENATYYLNTELSSLPVSQKATETLQAMQRSIEYADRIVKDLQSFASKREALFRETDINAIVKDTLLYVKKPKNLEIIIELGQLPKIEADREMLKRIFVNLAVNGIQAMEEKGGTLKVSTKKSNSFIEVCFKDTGIGIKKEDLRKLFTPFFTTKAQGMGVGLTISKRFAELHDGSIKVESKEGEGSTFTVKLPIQRNGGGKLD